MMKTTLIILVLLLSVGVYSHRIYARYNTEPPKTTNPIVVELFTSQGCSSCPPADKLFKNLAAQDNIIALGFHVSYWNHLSWKDTLSDEYYDIRQHGYAGERNTRRIYTPQMIVNGTNEFIGSRSDKIETALKYAQAHPIKNIEINAADSTITYSLPEAEQDTYRLWAFGYKHKTTQSIGRGENSGRTIEYANPVMSYTNLGGWKGLGTTQTFDKPDADIDGIAILAQKNGYGEIIAAGKYQFSK